MAFDTLNAGHETAAVKHTNKEELILLANNEIHN
jgi:hypothetical protein